MNDKFTVEEINLISIFTGETGNIGLKRRGGILQDINSVIRFLSDRDMITLSEQVTKKLKKMSDEEFAAMEFIAAEE